MSLQTRLLRDPQTIDALAPAWDALVHEQPKGFEGLDATASFLWFDALRAAFPQARQPEVLTCWQDERLVGVLPLIEHGREPFGSRLSLPTELHGGRCGPLVDSARGPDVMSALLGELARQRSDWCTLRLTVPEGPGAELVRDACDRLGWHWSESALAESTGFELSPPDLPLQSALTPEVWQALQSARHRVEQRHQRLSVRTYTQPDEAQELLGTVLQIERSRATTDAPSTAWTAEQQQAFLAALVPRALSQGGLCASVLWVDQEPAAYQLGLLREACYCGLGQAQAQPFAELNPSALLMAETLPSLSDRGVLRFDCLSAPRHAPLQGAPAAYPYRKRRFELFSPGWRGTGFRAWSRLRRPGGTAEAVASPAQVAATAPADAPLTRRVLSPGPELDALAPSWDALVHDRPSDLLGQDGTNLACWMAALVDTRERAAAGRVLTLQRGGRLVAALPLTLRKTGLLGDRLDGLTELYGGRNGLLTAPDEALEHSVELLSALPLAYPRWVSLKLSVMRDSPATHALRAACAELGLHCLELPLPPTPYVHLCDSSETFLKGVSRSLQRNLRHSGRLADAKGGLVWREFERPEEAPEMLETLLQVERQSWKHAAGSSVSRHPEQEAFYRALAPRALGEGLLYALVLYLKDLPIAYQLGLRRGEVFSCLKSSMHQDHAELRPAYLLKLELFNRLRARGVHTVDLMGVVEPHKLVWATNTPTYERVSLLIHRNNGRGNLVRLGRRLRARLSRRPLQPMELSE